MKKEHVQLLFIGLLLAALAGGLVQLLHHYDAQTIYLWYKDHMTYGVIVLLMAIESSVVPLPSEVVVPPAAYFALQQGSDLNVWMVIIMATLGAFMGSIINYGLSVLLGRPIIYRFAESAAGRLLRLSAAKLDYAEDFFRRKGAISIFVSRLLPVVRHLISIPAGLSRMNLGTFTFYTVLGAGLWNVVLASLGYLLYLVVPDDSQLFVQLEHYSHYIKIAGVVLLVAAVGYIIYKVKNNKKDNDKHSIEP